MKNIKRRLITGAAVTSLAAASFVGPATAATAAPEQTAAPTVQAASTASSHDFQYISQLQDQASQFNDCGPASILMALLQNDGDLPESYSESDQAAAMEEIRAESGRGADQFLFTDDIQSILSDHGVEGTVHLNENATGAIDDIKDGKQAIVLTKTGVISGQASDPGYGHFVYVSDYDEDEGTFTINDPLQTSGKPYQATEEQLTNIITQPAEGNTPWVYTV